MQKKNLSVILCGLVLISIFVSGCTTQSAPVANNDYVAIKENTGIGIDVLRNDASNTGGELHLSSVTTPSNGSCSINGSMIVYNTPENFTGVSTFQYTVSDDKGGKATATVTIIINPHPIAFMETSKGMIVLELRTDKAPITTANFIKLANDGFFNGLVFHRVIKGFVIQGGGFYPNGTQKQDPYPPIQLEVSADLLHVDGAISMARLPSDVNSATSQFFICDGAQSSLDGGYAVFGKVVYGMNIVHTITSVETTTKYQNMQDWPVDDILMESVTIQNQ
jgi:cyclophilin family peptidyl-prolyl cis-trans isomerase